MSSSLEPARMPLPMAQPARDPRPGLSGVLASELTERLAGQGQPAYRARQIAGAVWRGGAATPDEVTTLPPALRTALVSSFRWDTVADTELRLSDGGLTEKALHRLSDGGLVESVLMHYPARGGQR